MPKGRFSPFRLSHENYSHSFAVEELIKYVASYNFLSMSSGSEYRKLVIICDMKKYKMLSRLRQYVMHKILITGKTLTSCAMRNGDVNCEINERLFHKIIFSCWSEEGEKVQTNFKFKAFSLKFVDFSHHTIHKLLAKTKRFFLRLNYKDKLKSWL